MLDILLLVLQIVTLILLFLFIWWVIRSTRRDLVRSVEGVQVAGEQQALPWDAAGEWPPPTQAAAGRRPTYVEPRTQQHWEPEAIPPTPASGPGAGGPPRVAAPTVPGTTTGDLPYPAALVVAAPDVPVGDLSPALSSPGEIQTRRATRASERSAAMDGLDMTDVVSPRLVVESSPVVAPGQEIRLEGWLGIGRSPDSDLVLNEAFVSSTHARVVRRGQYFFIEDLGSTNGTYVNERRVTEAQLKLDTRLRIGETVFRYEE